LFQSESLGKERLRKAFGPYQNHSEKKDSERKDSEILLALTGKTQKARFRKERLGKETQRSQN
jgi:hypothetical protein